MQTPTPTSSNDQNPEQSAADPPVHPRLRPRYQILVQCRDEEDQKAFHARMVREKRKCRVLTM
jgi:hypothetical protein